MARTGDVYAGQGPNDVPLSHSFFDFSAGEYSLGGTRIYPMLIAAAQLATQLINLKRAREYYNLNKRDYDFWNGLYKGRLAEQGASYDGVGGSALDEAMARPYYSKETYTPQHGALDYIHATGRGQSKAALHLDREWLNTRRKIGRYNVGQGRRIDYKYSVAKLNAELEGWNLGFRFEDNRKMLYDEQRHAHQAEILNIGQGFGNMAREGLATATKWLDESRSQMAGELGSISSGLSTHLEFNKLQREFAQKQYNREGAGIGPPRSMAGSGDEIFKNNMGDTDG